MSRKRQTLGLKDISSRFMITREFKNWMNTSRGEGNTLRFLLKASFYLTVGIYFMMLIPNAPHSMISLHICDSNQPVLMNSALLLYLWPAGLEIWFGTQSVGNTKPSIFGTRGCFD